MSLPVLALVSALSRGAAVSAASTLQARVDSAAPGARIIVPPGVYPGDLRIDRPVTLVGQGRPLLQGSGVGTVVSVRADDVTIEGFDVDGKSGGDLGADSSGIHVAGKRAAIRDCRITRTLFGVYLREADGASVERCDVRGIREKEAGEKGSGIHVWNTDGFRLSDNTIEDARDGIYVQSSRHGVITRNRARELRYGLHYMFSDDNRFEDNVFENAAAGAALMYSKHIVFRRNRFLHNRGFASVGLLLKACDELEADSNLIADNARGVFLEGSYRNVFRRNLVAESDTAIVLYDSCGGNRFEGNSFVANLTPLTLVGRRTDTVFRDNYWSDNEEPDLDGDGRSDRPYRLTSVFDHFRGNLTAADLFTQGIGARALGLAERAFPVLEAVSVEDPSPLAAAPALPEVPRPDSPRRGRLAGGVASAAATLLLGSFTLLAGRR